MIRTKIWIVIVVNHPKAQAFIIVSTLGLCCIFLTTNIHPVDEGSAVAQW